MDNKLQKWIRWMKVIHDDIQQLMITKDVFWKVQDIIKNNPKIHKPSPFYSYLGNTYVAYVLMGVRRQLKVDEKSISFSRLLREIASSPQTLSRCYYIGLYKETAAEDRANKDFEQFSGTDEAHIDPNMVNDDLAKLKDISRQCEDFADKRIAHRDKREPEILPKFIDLDACVEYLDKLYVKYHLVFHAEFMDSLLPTYQGDFKSIFREPWIKNEKDT